MEFTFIDNNKDIDSDTRSLIRHRAAKGWNLGRKINRASRVKAFERQVPDKPSTTTGLGHVSTRTSHEDSKDMFHSRRDVEGVLPPVEPIIGDSVSILSLPIEVAQKDRVLLYDANISATHHITQVFRLINERISRGERITYPTMAVVMSLSSYESTRGRYDRGIIHLLGLYQMIEMRGGLDRIGSEKPEIMQKIYRADLDYALRLGSSPKLDIELFENTKTMARLAISPTSDLNIPFTTSDQRFREQLGTDLRVLWDSVAVLSRLVNEASAGERSKLPTTEFLRSHVWLGHKLLKYAPLSLSRSLNRSQSIAHLGLLTIISSFLCGLDRRVTENSILSKMIQMEASLESNGEDQELLLWLLFLGAAVILQDPSHDTWLIPKTWEIMQMLQLDTWGGMMGALSKFPWINDFYEKESLALYYRVSHYGGIQSAL
ncbi:hypothetical protein M441DRAFT_82420 [Trichoderma asperellum CBS 433.97]|uniref:Transcription factor domain-containing protein n=1 Tax=Trichoderma asperellum (strain ATCC 204424 / CBS 433.97 / NBRC 101777) TaxID=1042311 RepID=A0A2T3Z0A3_TRIA4|nr:hypothetical protein M441DRAFT_82420 [Trichoderma asperellum CBS 433.97]PTB38236.1 hypothetical protein M441DRAFT_82420 [Trichoderma asperellum CBS 433.97]